MSLPSIQRIPVIGQAFILLGSLVRVHAAEAIVSLAVILDPYSGWRLRTISSVVAELGSVDLLLCKSEGAEGMGSSVGSSAGGSSFISSSSPGPFQAFPLS